MKKNQLLISESEKERILSLHVLAKEKSRLNTLSEQFDKTKGTYKSQKDQVLNGVQEDIKNKRVTVLAGTLFWSKWGKDGDNMVRFNVSGVNYYYNCGFSGDKDIFTDENKNGNWRNGPLSKEIRFNFCNGDKLKTWDQVTGVKNIVKTPTTGTGGSPKSIKLPNLTNKNFCTLPNDKIWKYAKMDDGTWYTSKDQINWFQLMLPKYQKAIDILSKDASCEGLEPVVKLELLKINDLDSLKKDQQQVTK